MGPRGSCPAPSPLAPCGVTYTFLVTGWDADCAAASLLAPARTHQLQPGRPGGCPTLSMHSHDFFFANKAVSGGKRATHPPWVEKDPCCFALDKLFFSQCVSIARHSSPWHPASDLSYLGPWCQTPETQQDFRRGEQDLTNRSACPKCTAATLRLRCLSPLSLLLLPILPGSKWHQGASAGDHAINPVVCL